MLLKIVVRKALKSLLLETANDIDIQNCRSFISLKKGLKLKKL